MDIVLERSLRCDAVGVYSPDMTKPTKPVKRQAETVAVPRWILQAVIPVACAVLIGIMAWYFKTHIPLQIASQLAPTNDRLLSPSKTALLR